MAIGRGSLIPACAVVTVFPVYDHMGIAESNIDMIVLQCRTVFR